MNSSNLKFKNLYFSREKVPNSFKLRKDVSSRQSLKSKFDREHKLGKSSNIEHKSRTNCSSWCDAFSLTVPNVSAKRAWKSGAEKLTQTFNNVRNSFGTLSRRIKKSTKRRQPLINLDSPQTPATPYTRSKVLLGRTPTKLYSPFHIDSPKGKENILNRELLNKGWKEETLISTKKKCHQSLKSSSFKEKNSFSLPSPEMKLSSDLLQTQIGIYEFQSVASKIVKSGKL